MRFPAPYDVGDHRAALKHAAWQDWMIWLLRRGRVGEDVSISEEFAAEGACILAETAQTVSSGIISVTTLAFDKVVWDSSGYADLANDRLTVPSVDLEGVYMLQASWGLDAWASASGFMIGHIEITNPDRSPPPYVAKMGHQRPVSGMTQQSMTACWPLFVGDRIRLRVQHSHGTSRDTFDTAQNLSRLSIVRLGPWSGDAPE